MNLLLGLLVSLSVGQVPAVGWKVDTATQGHIVSPSLYGIFFEEINCAGDGGIYAELVRNRGFEDSGSPVNWTVAEGQASLDKTRPLSSASPTSLKLGAGRRTVLENSGYWGMAIKSGEVYDFAIHSRGDGGKLNLQLVAKDGTILGQANLVLPQGEWKQSKASFKASNKGDDAKLVLSFDSAGPNNIDLVSLFPRRTWKARKNGLRPDLVGMLNELRPSFVRFPGGCWVEGDTMAYSLRWKQTIGEQHERRTQPNIWNYMSTNGLGYHEYLQLCEDIKADALFVINCGMSHKENVPMDKMDEYVQDALDAIEYATGPVTSKWGAVRAKNGHPQPFPLRYLQIGNENGGPAYEERYGLMYRAIKQKYPQMILVANHWGGGGPKKTPIDILDEHYYSNPEFFVSNADRYDTYDRTGPKIYVGEYAVTQGNGAGSLRGALAEAAFMAGMERNSDIVTMSSYAPLFANVNHKAWNPDLIYFDSSRVVGTPSYYVQKLFFRNRANEVIPSKFSNVPTVKRSFPPGRIGVGTWNTRAEYKDIRVTQNGKTLFESKDGSGLTRESGTWEIRDGAYAQTSDATPARAVFGDPSWTSYTVEMKARKMSGAEGFMVTFGHRDARNWLWWNLGGWGNTQHGVEIASGGGTSIVSQRGGSIETGRWYDLKIEYTEKRLRGYIDGRLMLDQELTDPKSIHGVAGWDKDRKTAILKVVNVSDQPLDVEIDLSSTGWGQVAGTIELLSGQNADENTLGQPPKVAPRTADLGRKPSKFIYRLTPRTLAVLKVKRG